MCNYNQCYRENGDWRNAKDVKETISQEEFKKILRALFDLYGFELTNVTLNDGLNSRWEGYGMGEYEVKSAYFKGVTINVNKKKNVTLGKVMK